MACTFVTGYIDLQLLEIRPQTKTFEDYAKLSVPILKSGLKLVVFCDCADIDTIRQVLIDFPASANMRLIQVDPRSDLRYNTPAFHAADLPETCNRDKDTHWYMMVNLQKAHWVEHVIELNPFGTETFCWIDLGLNHIVRADDFQMRCFMETTAEILSRMPPSKIVCGSSLFPFSSEQVSVDSYTGLMIGGLVGGKADAWRWLARAQEEVSLTLFKQHNKLTWETLIWQILYLLEPTRFALYPSAFDCRVFQNLGDLVVEWE